VLVDSCNKSVSAHLAIYDLNSKGKVCCVKKVIGGDQDKFDDWAKKYKDSTKELSGMGDGSSSSSGSNGGVPGLKRKLYLEVYNTTIESNSKPILIAHNTKVNFKSLNNYKEGKCLITIQKAKRSFNAFLPAEDSTVINVPSLGAEDCPLGTKLDGSEKFLTTTGEKTTYYLLTYILTDKSGKQLQQVHAVLNVSREDIVVGDLSHLQIKTVVSPTAPRSQNNHCFVSAYLDDTGRQTKSLLTFQISTLPEDVPCTWSSKTYTKLDDEKIFTTTSDSKKYCLRFADRVYPQINATAIASTAGCNIIHVVPYSIYKKYFLTNCELSCEDYVGSNKISCYDYLARNKECQYTANCNFVRDSMFKSNCLSCDASVVNCSSYTTKRACQENECLDQELCTWIFGLPTGTCESASLRPWGSCDGARGNWPNGHSAPHACGLILCWKPRRPVRQKGSQHRARECWR